MDSKKYRRQQVLNTLGKHLDFNSILAIIVFSLTTAWVIFLGWYVIKIIKHFIYG